MAKTPKPLTWENYHRLVYRIAHRVHRNLPRRQKTLIDVEDLVNQCAVKWEYLIAHYDPQYQFTTLLTAACYRILNRFVFKEWQDNFIVDAGDPINEDGDQPVDLIEQAPCERVHDLKLVGLEKRFLQFYQLASPQLRHFLRYYVLEGRFKGGNLKPIRLQITDEIRMLSKRFEIGTEEMLLLYGTQPHAACRPSSRKVLVKEKKKKWTKPVPQTVSGRRSVWESWD